MSIVISVFVESSTWGHCGIFVDAGPPHYHVFDFESDTHGVPRYSLINTAPPNARLHPVAQAAPPLLDMHRLRKWTHKFVGQGRTLHLVQLFVRHAGCSLAQSGA